MTFSSHSTVIVLTAGFIACGGGKAFSSGATGGRSNSGAGGTVGSGGTQDNDGGLSTGGISTDGGAPGFGGDTNAGGNAGTGGGSGYASMTCAELQTAYATELALAKTCSTGASNTCVPQTELDALECGCPVFVSSDRTGAITGMEQIRGVWNSKKCSTGITCGGTCAIATTATCVASATTAKSGICTPSAT